MQGSTTPAGQAPQPVIPDETQKEDGRQPDQGDDQGDLANGSPASSPPGDGSFDEKQRASGGETSGSKGACSSGTTRKRSLSATLTANAGSSASSSANAGSSASPSANAGSSGSSPPEDGSFDADTRQAEAPAPAPTEVSPSRYAGLSLSTPLAHFISVFVARVPQEDAAGAQASIRPQRYCKRKYDAQTQSVRAH